MSYMQIELSGVQVRADEWSESCSTAIHSVSGYVVVVVSVLERRGLLVASSYLANLSGRTAASHLHASRRRSAVFAQRMIEAMPGQTHARACLLDHAAELRDAVEQLLPGEEVTVEISDAALERACRVWSQPPRD